MDKRRHADIFRERLSEAMDKAGMNRMQLAEAAHIDRSTLGQLLAKQETRLPNGHTLAELCGALGVSADWLIGLSNEAQPVTTFLEGAMNFTPLKVRSPVDENLMTWYQESAGSKLRHVPATLPDMMKTEHILHYEYKDYVVKTSAQAIADTRSKLAYTRMPQADTEICLPVQALEIFAEGRGIWRGLDRKIINEQLAYMSELVDELYPSLRVYAFDQTIIYAAPYTVFGTKRAALYLGQNYFVLNTVPHIRSLIHHFDDLVRHTKIHAHEMADFLKQL